MVLNFSSARRRLRRPTAVIVLLAFPLVAASVSGCGGGSSDGPATTVTQAFDFNAGMQGWTSDVSDLPANYNNAEDGFNISYSVASLPTPLDTSKKALRLTSFNQSDDLWQFLKRQVTGLKANTRYQVRVNVEFASDAPENSSGVGGSPGSSVYVKVGAATQVPSVVIKDNARVFTLDKGNNANEGTQARNVGNVGISGDTEVYKLKQLGNDARPLTVITDSDGKMWVYFGADSGYEGRKTLYYTNVKLNFAPA